MSGERVVRDKIWYVDDGKLVKIGFNRDFLVGLQAECWHIMPANTKSVKEKAPLVTVENNEEMYSIPSPVSGYVMEFSQKASNFPDKLVETDVVVKITREEIKKPVKAATSFASVNLNEFINVVPAAPADDFWANQIAVPRAPLTREQDDRLVRERQNNNNDHTDGAF